MLSDNVDTSIDLDFFRARVLRALEAFAAALAWPMAAADGSQRIYIPTHIPFLIRKLGISVSKGIDADL